MGLPLKDIRAKVPVEVWALVKGYAIAQRREESEVIRDVLVKWYDEINHASTVAEKLMRVEGITGSGGD